MFPIMTGYNKIEIGYIALNSETPAFHKSNQIKSNQIKSNQIKSNQIKSNQILKSKEF
jgi:hypothetical protein